MLQLQNRGKHIFQQSKALARMNVGYKNSGYNLRFGMPFQLTAEEWSELENKGKLFTGMIDTACQLYKRMLFDGFPAQRETHDLIQRLCEGGLTKEAIQQQQEYHLHVPVAPPPAFMRGDMIDLDIAAEVNIPGGGLGTMQAMAKLAHKNEKSGVGLARGWATCMQKMTNMEKPRVHLPILNDRVQNCVLYFVNILNSLGIRATPYKYDEPFPNPKNTDMIVLSSFRFASKRKNWNKAWQAHMDGNVLFDHPPSAIFDSKAPEALAFLPQTQQHFSDEIRSLFPATYVVRPDATVPVQLNGDTTMLPIKDIPYIPQGKRRFVLKYAGADERGGGGQGVYQLDGSIDGANNLIESAMAEWEKRQPWIIQPRIRSAFKVAVLDGETGKTSTQSMRARIMPYYTSVNGDTSLVNVTALFSRNWKVHGNPEAVHCPVYMDENNTNGDGRKHNKKEVR